MIGVGVHATLAMCSRPGEEDDSLEALSFLQALYTPACIDRPFVTVRSNLNVAVVPYTSGGQYEPAISETWQWQLQGVVNDSYAVDFYNVDLFDTDTSTVTSLKGKGFKVVCYFSAGSSENWREDFSSLDRDDLGCSMDGWAGERWLDIGSQGVYDIMLARLDLADAKGCDGVELDNVNGYTNQTGFALTAEMQLAFNRNLANEAHNRGLFIALKNDGDQVTDLVDYFDLALNERCHEFDECDLYDPFIVNGKPVWNGEYASIFVNSVAARNDLCATATGESFRTLILPRALDDSFRFTCD